MQKKLIKLSTKLLQMLNQYINTNKEWQTEFDRITLRKILCAKYLKPCNEAVINT